MQAVPRVSDPAPVKLEPGANYASFEYLPKVCVNLPVIESQNSPESDRGEVAKRHLLDLTTAELAAVAEGA